ncbi:MAG: helix-turn-helix transcriptional regulator [Acidimicrobiia bacterium]|nr:helix-turn-helix transcriptional regulator [Acidimicrobiia bacterium]
MNTVREIRDRSGMTQAELATAAGTSQPTVAAYESASKSPTMRTVERLAGAAGLEAVVDVVRPMTREDRRSILMHRAIAVHLHDAPKSVVAAARRNLATMSRAQPGARPLLDQWRQILRRPVDEITDVMTDPRGFARELRQVTPFAGVLSASERADVYRRFRVEESRR